MFVSYAHDSDRHKRQVLDFCTFLRDECGIDVHLDQQYEGPRQDWALWAATQIQAADFVIVVASPEYKRMGEGRAAPDERRGSQFEAALLREMLTRNLIAATSKILPVVLPGNSIQEIPDWLQPHAADHYVITEFTQAGVASLRRALSGQASRDTGTHDRPRRQRIPPYVAWIVAVLAVITLVVVLVVRDSSTSGSPSGSTSTPNSKPPDDSSPSQTTTRQATTTSNTSTQPTPTAVPVRWQGTLRMRSDLQLGHGYWLDSDTPTATYNGDLTYVGGNEIAATKGIVAWGGPGPPEQQQCAERLSTQLGQFRLNVPVGSMACFRTGLGSVGYLKVATASRSDPSIMMVEATVWHQE